jgi:uncharacterized protein
MTRTRPVRLEELPREIAVFPLPGVVLFPRGLLPLNIFEPRYLNMIDDAMRTNRLIGMVQSTGGPKSAPQLARVGGVGEIASCDETEDGRYLITLTGVCRFTIAEECEVRTPYRQVVADWTRFQSDLDEEAPEKPALREAFLKALMDYIEREGMKADWDSIRSASLENLVHALGAGGPFSPIEKQALLEAPDLTARAGVLINLFEGTGRGSGRLQ